MVGAADKQANISGEEGLGAEHFVLSALNLPDGSAKHAFDWVGANTNEFRDAINKQYREAFKFSRY